MAAEKKLMGDRFPSPGISYILPDRSWLTIPLGANGDTIRKIQGRFWLAWAKHHQFIRSSTDNVKKIAPLS